MDHPLQYFQITKRFANLRPEIWKFGLKKVS